MALRIGYAGHSTVVVDLDGVRLLTDPLLRRRVAHLRALRRRFPPDSLRGVDAVLISHAHYDHLDLPSLERLGKSMPVVLPRGLGRLLRGSAVRERHGSRRGRGDLDRRGQVARDARRARG